MTDVIFDIDGTLANADHRVHLILDPAHWVARNGGPPKPDWGGFLDNSLVKLDSPIPETWAIMEALLIQKHRVIFITGRPLNQQSLTWHWLTDTYCPVRNKSAGMLMKQNASFGRMLYMRPESDRRSSAITKAEGLACAREEGWNPTFVFEDRIQDTLMWREQGLRCLQVAEGNY